MKNKIFSIILAIFLLLPISVQAVEENIPADTESQVAEEVVNTQQLDEDLQKEDSPIVRQAVEAPYKQPISKRKLIKKFIIAMFAVVASSMLLYTVLTFYNKIRGHVVNRVKTPDGEISLEAPDDMEGAVRAFLKKTKWN